MDGGFQRTLDHLRSISDSKSHLGRQFERLMAFFCKNPNLLENGGICPNSKEKKIQAHANQNMKKENSIKITARSVLLTAALAVAKISGTPAMAQTETRISSEITLVKISEKTVVLGTDLDDQNNRMGFQFTCYPRPKATFPYGFLPQRRQPGGLGDPALRRTPTGAIHQFPVRRFPHRIFLSCFGRQDSQTGHGSRSDPPFHHPQRCRKQNHDPPKYRSSSHLRNLELYQLQQRF